MPRIMEAIDKMTVQEKFETAKYLWSSLSQEEELIPAWHATELAKTEARVAADVEKPIPWELAKAILGNA